MQMMGPTGYPEIVVVVVVSSCTDFLHVGISTH